MKQQILIHLIYCEVFSHPLSEEELRLKIKDSEDLSNALSELLSAGLIFAQNGYYYIREDSGKVERRIKASQLAQRMLPKAYKKAMLISKFPYVESVGISGSLSKGVLHEDADFDFFIITTPNRLWIARTLLILYKKVFLLNSRKYFCVNYFIDTENLEIEEKNIFTAMEISTLIHVVGKNLDTFFEKNKWVNDFLHYPKKSMVIQKENNKPIITRTITSVLKGNFGEKVDNFCMKITLRKWNKKFGNQLDSSTFDLTMKSRKYISKHHPQDFQNKILAKNAAILASYKLQNEVLLKQHGIDL